MIQKMLLRQPQQERFMARKNFAPLLIAIILSACALSRVELLPLEATLGKTLDVTIYKVPT